MTFIQRKHMNYMDRCCNMDIRDVHKCMVQHEPHLHKNMQLDIRSLMYKRIVDLVLELVKPKHRRWRQEQ